MSKYAPENEDLPPPYQEAEMKPNDASAPPAAAAPPVLPPYQAMPPPGPQQYQYPLPPPPAPGIQQATQGQQHVVFVPLSSGQHVRQFQTPQGPVVVVTNNGGGGGPIGLSGLVIRSGAGTCRTCRVGSLQEEIPWLFIILAILFFPIGLLCLCCTDKRCNNCGARY